MSCNPKKLAVLLLLLGLLTMLSCSDDDCPTCPDTNLVLTGQWEVVDGHTAHQFNFNEDKTVDVLYEANYGFRSYESHVYFVTESQVLLSYTAYNVSMSGDTLRLIHVSDTITLARNDTGPTLDDWLAPVVPSTVYNAPIDRAVDIAWHVDRLWYANAYTSDFLYKFNLWLGMADDSLYTTQSAWGICWADDDLWVSSNGSDNIYRIDTLTGSSLHTSPDMGAWLDGIAYDGQYLWTGSNNSRTIYRYDPVADIVTDSFYIDLQIHGMTYYDGYLYACTNGVINRIQMSPFEVVAAYRVEGAHIEGISHDGTGFWLAYEDNDGAHVAQVSL